jgi:hypothetical protein
MVCDRQEARSRRNKGQQMPNIKAEKGKNIIKTMR